MKQTNEQLRSLTEVVGTIGPGGSGRVSVGNPAVAKIIQSERSLDSPSKKRKTPGDDDLEDVVFANNATTYANIAGAQNVHNKTGQVAGIKSFQPPGIKPQGVQPSGTPRQRKPSIMYGKAKMGKDGAEELLAADVALVASSLQRCYS